MKCFRLAIRPDRRRAWRSGSWSDQESVSHADYTVLQRYVGLAIERDLGSRKDWVEFVVANPALASSW